MTTPELYGEGEPRWQNEAACKGEPAAIFFPPRGDYNLHRQAVAFCNICPVKEQCLDEHLGEPDGIFGGLGSTGRRIEARRRVAAGTRVGRARFDNSDRCGSTAGYDRHKRKGEEACQACREARNAYNRRYNQDRRARLAAVKGKA